MTTQRRWIRIALFVLAIAACAGTAVAATRTALGALAGRWRLERIQVKESDAVRLPTGGPDGPGGGPPPDGGMGGPPPDGGMGGPPPGDMGGPPPGGEGGPRDGAPQGAAKAELRDPIEWPDPLLLGVEGELVRLADSTGALHAEIDATARERENTDARGRHAEGGTVRAQGRWNDGQLDVVRGPGAVRETWTLREKGRVLEVKTKLGAPDGASRTIQRRYRRVDG